MQALDRTLQGDAHAIEEMIDFYSYYDEHRNEASDKELSKEIDCYRAHAAKGNSFAQYFMGYFTHEGIGIAKDIFEAIEWYEMSAAQNNPYGFYGLGDIYCEQKNFDLAKPYLQKAGDHGYYQGYHYLAWTYEYGQLVAKDREEAKRWFKLAADKGYISSCYTLGYLYREEGNFSEAIKQLKMATLGGLLHSMDRLDEIPEWKNDTVTRFLFLKKVEEKLQAEGKSDYYLARSRTKIGMAHLQGNGTRQNYFLAFTHLHYASPHVTEARQSLERFEENPTDVSSLELFIHVTQREAEAKKILEKAAGRLLTAYCKEQVAIDLLHAGVELEFLLSFGLHKEAIVEEYDRLQDARTVLLSGCFPKEVGKIIGSYLPWFVK